MTSDSGQTRAPVRRIVGSLLSVAIIGAAVGVGLYVVRMYYLYPRTDDAYVRANTVGIAPHVSGPIVNLPVVDNQPVHEGDLLFEVDPRPYQHTLEKAEAQLKLTQLEVQAYDEAIRAARAEQRARRYMDAGTAGQELLSRAVGHARRLEGLETRVGTRSQSDRRSAIPFSQSRKNPVRPKFSIGSH